MIDFGIVKPGTTLYIPFASFAGSTGASATLTGLATTDIEVYKDGSTTQRASDSGYALLDTDGIDFDGITGIHGFSIDLADNTTANFWAAGSQYWVVVSSVTIDSQTVNFIAATFRIGYPDAVLNTTIASLSSQTSFTLTAGPAEDDALNGCQVVIHDVASAVQVGRAVILDYTGSTKTVTLAAGTTFTAAAGDNIAVLGLAPLQPTTTGNKLDVTATGAAGIDWNNVENPTTTLNLSGTTVKTATDVETDTADIQTRLPAALTGGRIDASVGAMAANTLTASALATDAVNEIVDQVWTEAIADHSGTAGSTAEQLAAAGAAGDPWSTALPGAYGDGTAGKIVGTNLNATVSSRASQTTADAIETDTQDIQSRLPAALVGGRIDASVGAMASNVLTAAALATDAVTEIQSGLSTLDAAGIRTAVGLASANLDTQLADLPTVSEFEARTIAAATYATAANLATVAGYLDTEIAAILEDTGTTLPAQIAALSFSTLDAAGVRAAVGLASANLDTQLTAIDDYLDTEVAAIKAKTDNLPASPAAAGDIPSAATVAAAVLAAGDVDGFTLEETLKLCLAALAGKVSGASGTTVTIRAADDSKARITATVDSNGNRTAITLDEAG